jgi:hypothetical protein
VHQPRQKSLNRVGLNSVLADRAPDRLVPEPVLDGLRVVARRFLLDLYEAPYAFAIKMGEAYDEAIGTILPLR